MRDINQIYSNGAFVTPHGTENFDLFNPSTEAKIGAVRLGDVEDARAAIAAAKAALPSWSQTTKAERIAVLQRFHDAVAARFDDQVAAIVEEYGAPVLGSNGWRAWRRQPSSRPPKRSTPTTSTRRSAGRRSA